MTTGPALLNAAAAVGQAYSDSVPVLVVSPGMPLRHPATGNGLLHETRDQGAALAAVAAASLRPTSVAEIPTAVAQAFALMTSGRPRPVHLEVPLDVLDESDEVTVVDPVVRPAVAAGAPSVAAAAERLAGALRPVLLVGGGARGAAEQVRALAERLGAPVVTTTNGKGVLPEDHPLALGAGVHLPTVRDLVDEADVVLAVGTELAPSDLWYGALPLAGKLLRIDVDPVGLVTNAAPALTLLGDAAATLDGTPRGAGGRHAHGPGRGRLARAQGEGRRGRGSRVARRGRGARRRAAAGDRARRRQRDGLLLRSADQPGDVHARRRSSSRPATAPSASACLPASEPRSATRSGRSSRCWATGV